MTSIPTNAQDVLQRHKRKVYGRLLLHEFSSCGGKISGLCKTDVY